MQQKTNLLLAMLLLLYMAACKDKCKDYPEKEVYGLHPEDSVIVPYKGFDTLIFQRLDTSGQILDTITFIGSGNQYKETYIDRSRAGCPQTYYSTTCTIQFKDKTGFSLLKYKYIPNDNTTTFEILFADTIKFEYSDWDIGNKLISGHVGTIEVCGEYYYRVNVTFPQDLTVADCQLLYFDKYGQIVRIQIGAIIYNLITK